MDDPRYLLVKRGLYYRPDNCGYTGIKEHAGRYREVDALGLDGVMAIHEDEAPDYSSACFEDLKEAHLKSRIAALEAALKLAANRLHRCSVDYDAGTRQFIEVGEWAEEARQALGSNMGPVK